MTASFARSYSSTFTEARVREVMKPVFDDLIAISNHGFISVECATKWREDLTYMLSHQAISSFELQFRSSSGGEWGFEYEVSDDGYLLESRDSGGLQLYLLPDDCTAALVVSFREIGSDVRAEVIRRGWTQPASSLSGNAVRDRAYSSEGYSLVRHRIGDWE